MTVRLHNGMTVATRRRIYALGVTAKKSRKPIYANPLMGAQARIWTAGWRGAKEVDISAKAEVLLNYRSKPLPRRPLI